MEWNFIKFEGGSNANRDSAIVINKPNSLSFSSKFYQDNIVNEFKYAVLYYDTTNNAIAIRLTNNEEEKFKYSINHAKKGFGASIVPKSFFKENSIDTSKYAGRYAWDKEKIDGIGDVFIIKLDKQAAA